MTIATSILPLKMETTRKTYKKVELKLDLFKSFLIRFDDRKWTGVPKNKGEEKLNCEWIATLPDGKTTQSVPDYHKWYSSVISQCLQESHIYIEELIVQILTIVTLILLDPAYVTAYISINYEIVIIYLVSALTLLYCIVSVLMSFLLAKRGEDTPLTNCAFSEIIFATAGIMGWLIIIGIGGTISQRTIIETGERFGWIGAMAGLNVGCFLIIAAIFAANVVSEKILQRQSRFNKYDRGVYQQ